MFLHEVHGEATLDRRTPLQSALDLLRIAEGTTVLKRSLVRGLAVIGRNCTIGPNTYVGPYTSIGDDSKLIGADVEASIVIDGCVIETQNKIVNSLIGAHTIIRSANNRLPKGHQIIVGENSTLVL